MAVVGVEVEMNGQRYTYIGVFCQDIALEK